MDLVPPLRSLGPSPSPPRCLAAPRQPGSRSRARHFVPPVATISAPKKQNALSFFRSSQDIQMTYAYCKMKSDHYKFINCCEIEGRAKQDTTRFVSITPVPALLGRHATRLTRRSMNFWRGPQPGANKSICFQSRGRVRLSSTFQNKIFFGLGMTTTRPIVMIVAD